MKRNSGFSLVELLIVMVIIVVISAAVISSGFFSSAASHGGDQLINDLATRLYERRFEVKRLNGSQTATSLDLAAPPIEFDLTNPATTASLVTEGVDENDDGVDDHTGDLLTFLGEIKVTGEGSWRLVYRGDQFRLPSDWQLASTVSDLGSIPLIAGGARGRGVIVTRIAFDGQGRALYRNESGVWELVPSGTSSGKKADETAFWAFYFTRPNSPKSAIALAVYPSSGLIERFRYDGTIWRGFADRLPTNR